MVRERPAAAPRCSPRRRSGAAARPTRGGRSRCPAPSGPSSHLCPSADEGVDRRLLHVEREHAERLDRVHEEEHAAVAAEFARARRGRCGTRWRTRPTETVSTRVRSSIAARRSSIATRLPRLGTARTSTPRCARFIHGYWFAGYSSAGEHDVVAGLPREAFGDDADAVRGVRDEVHVVRRRGVDEPGGELRGRARRGRASRVTAAMPLAARLSAYSRSAATAGGRQRRPRRRGRGTPTAR